jgi:radical SAM protein with 4Fe4S-binding SPASM domain
MPCKIKYFSLTKQPIYRNLRDLAIVPSREILHRGLVMALKVIRGGSLRFPQNVHLEVTNRCNLSCPMCVFKNQLRPQGFMEFGLFEKIVLQCARKFSLEKMALMGLGEPFLHPGLIEMSRYAKGQGIRHVFTSTNATLMYEQKSRELMQERSFDAIAVSLDGATKSVYEQIRKGASFEQVMQNVLAFLKIRKEYHRKKPQLVLQFLIMRENYHEQEDFLKFWSGKLDNDDMILFRDVDTFGGQVEDHRLEFQIPKLSRRPCAQLWRDLIISWNGDVSVCCKDVNYLLKVGSLRETDLTRLWNSPAWEKLRSAHSKCRWADIPLCAKCSEWQ